MFNNTDCPTVKIDSNLTGLRYAWEYCLKQLPGEESAVAATGTITMTGVGVEGDTITVDGSVFTLVDDTPGAGEVEIGATAADTASALATAINALAGVNASVLGAVITVTAATPGAFGNSIELEEDTTATLSGAMLTGGVDALTGPEWRMFEPNSYNDFGSTINTVARNPINPSRQRKKGAVTGVEAAGGFQQDLTFNNTADVLQGFMFAMAREKATTVSMNAAAREITGVGAGYSFDNADGLFVQPTGGSALVLAQGFGLSANNGVKVATAVSAGAVNAAGLSAEASPPAAARLHLVGAQYPASDLSLTLNGDLVRLNTATGDFSVGFIAGEWIFIGGDAAGTQFDNNLGFARISTIDPDGNYLELDKVSWANPEAEAGTGKTIRLFYGTVIRNEHDPALIRRGTLQLERTLGSDADGVMSEYLIGAVPNEFTLNVPEEDKVTVDLSFIACDAEHRSGAEGLKSGTRPDLEVMDAINTSSDFSRIKMSVIDPLSSNPVPLFSFATELTLTINNNASANKAIGHLGAIDVTAGTFEVGGSVNVYFANIESVRAVRNNADITLDAIIVKDNQGMLFDIPLLSLGNGRLAVEQDQPIKLPLDTSAAESKFGNTLLFQYFPYLPDVAA